MRDGFVKVACVPNHIKVANARHNADSIIAAVKSAAERNVSIITFPELSITGYTCGDLFLQSSLINAAERELFRIAYETAELDIISVVGAPVLSDYKLYNCAVCIYHGDILAVVPKLNLPNYSEFYELRHFSVPDPNMTSINICGRDYPFGRHILLVNKNMREMCIGIELCEDLWSPNPPSVELAQMGASIILNLSAGDEVVGKSAYRRELIGNQSARLLCCYVYSNAGTGESTTDMVFSGHSLIYENGSLLAESAPFEEKMLITETDLYRLAHDRQRLTSFNTIPGGRYVYFDMPVKYTELTRTVAKNPFVPHDEYQSAHDVLNMQAYGLKKRIEHVHAQSVVLGISGGLDSTLALIVCVMACDILHIDRKFVHAVSMPCFGTSDRTRNNAKKLADSLNVSFEEICISESVLAHMKDLRHDPENRNVVYENAQARMRTAVLMNLSNKYGGFVVGTGDMSELALGWATYNGDHMSMYGVNASIPKTLIQHLIRCYASICGNKDLEKLLIDVLNTPISPELLPADKDGNIAQKTEELVGPYELHDFFLYYMLRWGFSPTKIYRLARYAFNGSYDDVTVKKWLVSFYRRFFTQQFKRSCLPDGAKVGSVCLSPRGDFRMPSDADFSLWREEAESL